MIFGDMLSKTLIIPQYIPYRHFYTVTEIDSFEQIKL